MRTCAHFKVITLRDHSLILVFKFSSENTQCEDFLITLFYLFDIIKRLKEIRAVQHGVVDPLQRGWKEECVSNASSVFVPLGQLRYFFRGGRTTHGGDGKGSWEFNATKGYPGENVKQRE